MNRLRASTAVLGILIGVLAGGLGSLGLYRWERGLRGTPSLPAGPQPATPRPVTPEAAATSPPTGSTGRSLFGQFCDACHPGGGAGLGPALAGPAFEADFADDAALEAVVREGRVGMPAFPETRISDADLHELIGFIRTLRAVAAETPTEVVLLGEMTWSGSYVRDIQPIFDAYCVRCHGETLAENGLRLDSYQGVMRGTRSGSVVTPGNASGSTLVWVIQGLAAPEIRMPHSENPLSPNRIQNIVLWIDAGAPGE